MKCPSCGAANLVHDIRDTPYTYKGETTVLPQVTGDYCPACDESILDVEQSRRTMNLMLEFNKRHGGCATLLCPLGISIHQEN